MRVKMFLTSAKPSKFFQVLTESEISMEGKLRVMKILEEQKKILRLCMSKPQVR